jgi:hypothetical protein
MADVGIKKVFIPKSDWPPVQFNTLYNEVAEREEINELYYDFRYRIVSEDRNRFSHWAPIVRYIMPDATAPFPYTASNRISVSSGGNPVLITATWSHPGENETSSEFESLINNTNSYDVWLRWTNDNTPAEEDWEDWQYSATVSTNSFSILRRDSSVRRIEIAIQIPTSIKIRDYNNNKITLFRASAAT